MTATRSLPVPAEGRLDRFLSLALPHLSRRRLREITAEGRVRINGHVAAKGARVRPGDVVQVPLEVAAVTALRPEPDAAIPLLYRDQHLFAVDKPAGVASVARSVLDTGTVANFAAACFPETRELERGGLEAGLVHRLDTATSGVLVGARDPTSYGALRDELRGSASTKTYRAVVRGAVAEDGSVTRPIRTHPGDPARVEVVDDTMRGGRSAETRFRVLSSDGRFSQLEIEIGAGARHQIRAHLASIGHPIVGDVLYGTEPARRLFLHAASVAFRHPAERHPITIRSALPADFDEPS